MKYALTAALVLSVAGALAVSQAAPKAEAAPPKTARACFMVDDVSGWKEGKQRGTLYLRTQRGDIYSSRLMGVCPDVDWSMRLGIKSRFSSRICEGDDAEVIVPRSQTGSNFTQKCDIDHLRKLSKEEIDQLDKRYRP